MKKSSKHSASNQRIHPSFPPQGTPMPSFMGTGYPGQGVPEQQGMAPSNTPPAFSEGGM
jgi:hypothetical protein